MPDLTPEQYQLTWQLLLNGNSHWVAYPRRQDGKQRQCSVGHVTFHGTDYTNYSALLVDEFRLGFGFWPRSKQGCFRWAAHDIEAGAHRRPTTPAQAHADALLAYQGHLHIATQRGNVILTLLEESSPGHYHVWSIFSNSESQDDHDGFILAVNRQIGNLVCLDKTTARAKRGFGDQFRAPGSWKR